MMMEQELLSTSPILIVFDLDHTIINDNSDIELIDVLKKKSLEKIRKIEYDHNWAHYMQNIFKIFKEENFTIDEIKEFIEVLPLNQGFKELFEFIGENKENFECIIISGSNTLFVEWIIKFNKIEHLFDRFYSNIAELNHEILIKLEPTHVHDCEDCDFSQCKRILIHQYLESRGKENIKYQKRIFIGDGDNDFCPAKIFNKEDFIFPRVDFRLEKKIDTYMSKNNSDFFCNVVKWNNGFDIIKKLKLIIGKKF